MNKATIIGVYSSDRETGEEYVTKNGNPYIKLGLEKEDGTKIYDAFFFTEKAHWKVESFFKSMNALPPKFKDTSYKNFLDFKGKAIGIEDGTDAKGYAKIYKYLALDEPIEPKMDRAAPIENADQDLLEDVPF